MKQLKYFFILIQLCLVSSLLDVFSYFCGDIGCLFCVKPLLTPFKCLACEYGYTLQNNKCQLINSCQPNQFVLNPQQIGNQLCGNCHPGCKGCNNDSSADCSDCQDGYYQVPSYKNPYLIQCLRCKNLDCKKCDDLGDCLECNNGLFLTSIGECLKCSIPYAQTCKNLKEVKDCIPGFERSEDKLSCIAKVSVNPCEMGEYPIDKICTDCSPNLSKSQFMEKTAFYYQKAQIIITQQESIFIIFFS